MAARCLVALELAVEPGDLDIEQLAPELGRLLALGAPGRLQAGVGERRLQRLLGPAGGLRHFRGDGRAGAQTAKHCGGSGRLRERFDEIPAGLLAWIEFCH